MPLLSCLFRDVCGVVFIFRGMNWNNLKFHFSACSSFKGAWFHWKMMKPGKFSSSENLFKADKSHFASEIEYHGNYMVFL